MCITFSPVPITITSYVSSMVDYLALLVNIQTTVTPTDAVLAPGTSTGIYFPYSLYYYAKYAKHQIKPVFISSKLSLSLWPRLAQIK